MGWVLACFSWKVLRGKVITRCNLRFNLWLLVTLKAVKKPFGDKFGLTLVYRSMLARRWQ